MDLLQAMRNRHSVRSYKEQPIEGKVKENLLSFVEQCSKESGLHLQLVILSRLVDTFFSRISLTMPPAPKSHNTACVLPREEPLHWQSRSSGYSSS